MAEEATDRNGTRRPRTRGAAGPDAAEGGAVSMTARRSAPEGVVAGSAAADAERATLEEIGKVFVREGREYRFPDGTEAFRDRGDRLLSQSENLVVVRAIVDIAVARDWQSLAVSGTEPFRQAVWAQAVERGLEVKGYTPTEIERARMASRAREPEVSAQEAGESTGADAAAQAAAPGRPARGRKPIEGTLVEHGRAPYQDKAENAMSYFARIRTAAGEKKIWGVDLERALRESASAPKVGDAIVLQQVWAEPVTVRTVEQGEAGEQMETSKNVLRNRWRIETREFVTERRDASEAVRDPLRDPKEVVRSQPQLAGAYLAMRGAEEIARTRIPHPEDQARFVELVRTTVADGIERGEAMPKVMLRGREQGREERSRSANQRDRAREDPEIGR
jgi:hypothetical protein